LLEIIKLKMPRVKSVINSLKLVSNGTTQAKCNLCHKPLTYKTIIDCGIKQAKNAYDEIKNSDPICYSAIDQEGKIVQ
jgi:hypothetical protein